MSIESDALAEDGTARYQAGGDPALVDYYPAWLDNLADDVTVEGSMLDGAIHGAQAVRTLYGDTQEFHFAGPWSENGWVEDYIARVEGRPLGCVVLVTRNAAGQTQHIVANYRPLSTVLHFSRLLGEQLTDTPYGKHFATSAD